MPGKNETCRADGLPAFARRGECAHIKKSREASFEGRRRGGWINIRSSEFGPTTPSAPSKESEHFFDAQPPRLAKAGSTPPTRLPANENCSNLCGSAVSVIPVTLFRTGLVSDHRWSYSSKCFNIFTSSCCSSADNLLKISGGFVMRSNTVERNRMPSAVS